MLLPESKALIYLSKVAAHFNVAVGSTACTSALLYGAGVRVLRPKSGGNAYVWWAADSADVVNCTGGHTAAATAPSSGIVVPADDDSDQPIHQQHSLCMMLPAAAVREAVKCRSSGMAALALMRQKLDWKQVRC